MVWQLLFCCFKMVFSLTVFLRIYFKRWHLKKNRLGIMMKSVLLNYFSTLNYEVVIAVCSNNSLCTTMNVEIMQNYKIFYCLLEKVGKVNSGTVQCSFLKICVKLVIYFYGALKISCQNQFSVYFIRKYFQF